MKSKLELLAAEIGRESPPPIPAPWYPGAPPGAVFVALVAIPPLGAEWPVRGGVYPPLPEV